MDAAREGDLDAFDELTLRIQPRLYSFCRRHLALDAVAEDVTQEALVRLFTHRGQYRSGRRVSTWLFTIAMNLIRDWYRANGRSSSLSDEAVAVAAENSRFRARLPDPLDEAQAAEMAENLVQALGALPPSTRELLELRSREDLTFEQAAERTGMKADAARAAASRAYRKLRAMLESREQGEKE